MKEKKGIALLSSFWIKVIALVTMTFDHVGAMLMLNVGGNYTLAIVFRLIGRIALPLFCFMIYEGIIHTKNPGKYFLRLGIMGTVISVAMILIEYLPIFNGFSMRDQGNIFVDLLVGALAVYLLRRKEWYFKLLALLPFGISIASFIVTSTEYATTMIIHWFPFFLRMQYHFYSVGMIILFYVGSLLSDLFLKSHSNKSGIPFETLKGSIVERYSLNIINLGVVFIWTGIFFIIATLLPTQYVYWHTDYQNFAILAGAFVLLYNGQRGYNAKWFQYGSYLYYPLHLIVIYGIGFLI